MADVPVCVPPRGRPQVAALVLETVKAIGGHEDVPLSSPLMSVGMDSFSTVELVSRIKTQLGVELNTSKLVASTTVAELIKMVQAQTGGGAGGSEARATEAAAPPPPKRSSGTSSKAPAAGSSKKPHDDTNKPTAKQAISMDPSHKTAASSSTSLLKPSNSTKAPGELGRAEPTRQQQQHEQLTTPPGSGTSSKSAASSTIIPGHRGATGGDDRQASPAQQQQQQPIMAGGAHEDQQHDTSVPPPPVGCLGE